LVCFQEKTLGDDAETAKTAYTPSTDAQVLALDILPVAAGGSAKASSHDLLVTFDNGDLICLSARLDVVRWVANLASITPTRYQHTRLEFTSIATAKSVTRGLLHSREDIAAILNSSTGDNSDLGDLTQILCTVGRRSDGTTILQLVQIQPRSPDLTTAQRSPLKHVASWILPKPAKMSTATTITPQYSLHAASGAFHVLTSEAILSYDFSGTVPKLCSELEIPASSVDSFLRLSQDVLFTTSPHASRVFDVKYNTLQASLSTEPAPIEANRASPAKKRKLVQPETDLPKCYLVAHYADLNMVVCTRDSEIVGMQIGVPVTRRRGATGTALLDALGKGAGPQLRTRQDDSLETWREQKDKLGRFAVEGRVAKFEEAFAKDLGIALDPMVPESSQENGINGASLTNGVGSEASADDAMAIDGDGDEVADNELRKWTLPRAIPDAQRQQYRQYALFALRTIFKVVQMADSQDDSLGSLRVQFFPPNVFQWLLHTDRLTIESIRTAFLEHNTDILASPSAIKEGDIVKALFEFDPDLHILSAVLNNCQTLPVGEVVQSLKLLMQSLDDQPRAEESTKLLTNGTVPSDDEMDVDIASELEAASEEIEHALSVLDHGILIRSHTLRPALIRLHKFAPRVISSTFRSMLSRRDLESLIRVLHLEMKNGGWTSPYDFVDPDLLPADVSTDNPDDSAVSIIASLLSCTLDAIGAGAWLASVGGSVDSESSENIIESLHHDTSEALNGFWEATYMRGLLSEFLRFASTLPKSYKPSSRTLEKQRKPFAVSGPEDELPMLPLGAKTDMGVEKTKAGKGGKKVERSKREIGMLISKRVPKYSFERIVI
jgi:hypothetical protein